MIFDGEKFAALVDRYVNGKKAERNRAILKAYYLEGLTYEEAAERFDMSAVHVGRLIHRHGDPILLLMQKG